MKKKFCFIGMLVLSVILTFVVAEVFSIYHIGSMPTLLTTLYLVSLFSIFSYLLFSGSYVISEKRSIKKIISLLLFFVALVIILGYLVVLDVDYLNWYMYSSPFYINVIYRSVEFLVPAIILIIVSIWLFKKK